MAKTTDLRLRNAVIYSIYVRNHTQEGTFRAVEADLDRIRGMGVDIIWLLPIHPIGIVGKKGTLGCPYANRDYRTVNPEYGTMAEFCHLVDEIHRRGMLCMIDVVYNHTSPDSTLAHEHPEYFHRTSAGNMGNRMGVWSDVVDLDYRSKGLWDYQIQSLRQWAQIVDGFRCDVASLIPIAFWEQARRAVAEVNPKCIWLAESVHSGFNFHARRMGLPACTDGEAYAAFDMEYDYDLRETLDDYMAGREKLHVYLQRLNLQEVIYPANYIKLRCLENHDLPRIAHLVPDPLARSNWNAFLFFQKGASLLYAGQEYSEDHVPSLFEKDVFRRSGEDCTEELTRLIGLKKRELPVDGWFQAWADDERHIVTAVCGNQSHAVVGVFSLHGQAAAVSVPVPDGDYVNLLSDETILIRGASFNCSGKPVWFRVASDRIRWPGIPE